MSFPSAVQCACSFDTIDTGGSFNSRNLNIEESRTYTFTAPGTYTCYCSYRPWMKGAITVFAGSA